MSLREFCYILRHVFAVISKKLWNGLEIQGIPKKPLQHCCNMVPQSFGPYPANLSTTCPSRRTTKYGTLSTPAGRFHNSMFMSTISVNVKLKQKASKTQSTAELALLLLWQSFSCSLLRKKSVKTCSSCGMIFGSINPSFQILALHQADQPHQFVPETALQDWTSRQAASSKREHWGQRPTTGRHSVKRNWGDGHLQERPFKSRTDVLNRNYEKYNRWLRRLEWRAIKW